MLYIDELIFQIQDKLDDNSFYAKLKRQFKFSECAYNDILTKMFSIESTSYYDHYHLINFLVGENIITPAEKNESYTNMYPQMCMYYKLVNNNINHTINIDDTIRAILDSDFDALGREKEDYYSSINYDSILSSFENKYNFKLEYILNSKEFYNFDSDGNFVSKIYESSEIFKNLFKIYYCSYDDRIVFLKLLMKKKIIAISNGIKSDFEDLINYSFILLPQIKCSYNIYYTNRYGSIENNDENNYGYILDNQIDENKSYANKNSLKKDYLSKIKIDSPSKNESDEIQFDLDDKFIFLYFYFKENYNLDIPKIISDERFHVCTKNGFVSSKYRYDNLLKNIFSVQLNSYNDNYYLINLLVKLDIITPANHKLVGKKPSLNKYYNLVYHDSSKVDQLAKYLQSLEDKKYTLSYDYSVDVFDYELNRNFRRRNFFYDINNVSVYTLDLSDGEISDSDNSNDYLEYYQYNGAYFDELNKIYAVENITFKNDSFFESDVIDLTADDEPYIDDISSTYSAYSIDNVYKHSINEKYIECVDYSCLDQSIFRNHTMNYENFAAYDDYSDLEIDNFISIIEQYQDEHPDHKFENKVVIKISSLLDIIDLTDSSDHVGENYFYENKIFESEVYQSQLKDYYVFLSNNIFYSELFLLVDLTDQDILADKYYDNDDCEDLSYLNSLPEIEYNCSLDINSPVSDSNKLNSSAHYTTNYKLKYNFNLKPIDLSIDNTLSDDLINYDVNNYNDNFYSNCILEDEYIHEVDLTVYEKLSDEYYNYGENLFFYDYNYDNSYENYNNSKCNSKNILKEDSQSHNKVLYSNNKQNNLESLINYIDDKNLNKDDTYDVDDDNSIDDLDSDRKNDISKNYGRSVFYNQPFYQSIDYFTKYYNIDLHKLHSVVYDLSRKQPNFHIFVYKYKKIIKHFDVKLISYIEEYNFIKMLVDNNIIKPVHPHLYTSQEPGMHKHYMFINPNDLDSNISDKKIKDNENDETEEFEEFEENNENNANKETNKNKGCNECNESNENSSISINSIDGSNIISEEKYFDLSTIDVDKDFINTIEDFSLVDDKILLLVNKYFKKFYNFNFEKLIDRSEFYNLNKHYIFSSLTYKYTTIIKNFCNITLKTYKEQYILINFLVYLNIITPTRKDIASACEKNIMHKFFMLVQQNRQHANILKKFFAQKSTITLSLNINKNINNPKDICTSNNNSISINTVTHNDINTNDTSKPDNNYKNITANNDTDLDDDDDEYIDTEIHEILNDQNDQIALKSKINNPNSISDKNKNSDEKNSIANDNNLNNSDNNNSTSETNDDLEQIYGINDKSSNIYISHINYLQHLKDELYENKKNLANQSIIEPTTDLINIDEKSDSSEDSNITDNLLTYLYNNYNYSDENLNYFRNSDDDVDKLNFYDNDIDNKHNHHRYYTVDAIDLTDYSDDCDKAIRKLNENELAKYAFINSIIKLKSHEIDRLIFNLELNESIYYFDTILRYLNIYDLSDQCKLFNINKLISHRIISPLKICGFHHKFKETFAFYIGNNNLLNNFSSFILCIKNLSDEIDKELFYNNPAAYICDAPYINLLDNFYKTKKDLLNVTASIKERSFQIFYDQYFIKSNEPKILLWLKCDTLYDLSLSLNFIYHSNNLIYYCANDVSPRTILFVENKDTYNTIQRLMKDNKLIFGRKIDTVFYSKGSSIIKSFKCLINRYIQDVNNPENLFLYFGDIDFPGIHIFEQLKNKFENFNIVPFVEAYLALIFKYEDLICYPRIENQQYVDCKNFLSYFSKDICIKIIDILKAGRYAPQEIVSEIDMLNNDYINYKHSDNQLNINKSSDQNIQPDYNIGNNTDTNASSNINANINKDVIENTKTNIINCSNNINSENQTLLKRKLLSVKNFITGLFNHQKQ